MPFEAMDGQLSALAVDLLTKTTRQFKERFSALARCSVGLMRSELEWTRDCISATGIGSPPTDPGRIECRHVQGQLSITWVTFAKAQHNSSMEKCWRQ